MIQRIQSFFLLDVVIIGVLLFFFPFQRVVLSEGGGIDLTLKSIQADITKPLIYIPLFLNMVSIILALFTIFQFKNRRKQMKLARALSIVNLFLLVTFLVIDYHVTSTGKKYMWSTFLPAGSIVFAYLAFFFIKKDDNLIRSSDRIR